LAPLRLCGKIPQQPMSGIVGIINFDGAPIDRDLLSTMTDYMSFRGPDAQAIRIEANVGFGHTLLKTTTHAETEDQPFTLDGKAWLLADARLDARAELINKLNLAPQTSPNDAELILHAYEEWGEACVEHLLGDFVFAIWDTRKRRLFCARDHLGVKPFFFANVANSFIFSNTLNVVRLDRRVSDELNEVAVGDYLLFGLNQDLSTTIFRDIQRLPPAHTLTISGNEIKTFRYWTPTTGEIRFRDARAYVDRFAELLTAAIKDRLYTNNIAISMSGGLDSTSLAAIASQKLGANVHACAVVYDRLIPDQERQYSTAAAEYLGIPIHHINADRYSLFDEQVAGDLNQPEPFLVAPLTGQFHDLLRQCATSGRVALTGYDGDTLMNEPPASHLKSAARQLKIAELANSVSWYLWTQRRIPPLGLRTRFKTMLRKQEPESSLPEWIAEPFAARINLRERLNEPANSPDQSRPSAMSALNSKVWAPLLEGYDPGATRLQLEVRHPFIDLRLLEFLLGIPAIPWCVNKHILRVAMKDQLPDAVLNRPKTPLAGDPALQLARHASVRWLDSFEVNPQLKGFVNLDRRRSLADEETSDGLWASLRVFALNYWLTNSQPMNRRASDNQIHPTRAVTKASIA
jgi:asparagine synthase (glutamine-hydrolysing)